jgi:hypothetical protein
MIALCLIDNQIDNLLHTHNCLRENIFDYLAQAQEKEVLNSVP